MNIEPENIQEVETAVGYSSVLVRIIPDKKCYFCLSENYGGSNNTDDADLMQDINERHKDAWKKLASM
jgi:hypothetical protein